MKSVLYGLTLLFSLGALALAEDPAALKPHSAVVTSNPLTVILGLAAVVALIFALAWALKRMGASHVTGTQSMKILSGMSVGPRERIVLVQVGEQQLLLGVAPGSVSSLHAFDEPVVTDTSEPTGEFQTKMRQFLQQGARR